jgi:TRAP-type transport system small permease protein
MSSPIADSPLRAMGTPDTHSSLLPAALPGPWFMVLLGRIVDWAVIAMGASMVVLVFFNVLLHIVSKDMAWTNEMGEMLMVWVSFFGGAAAAQRGHHMSITEFIDKLKGTARLRADFCVQLFSLVVVGFLTTYGWRLVNANWDNQLTVLEWPMAYQYMGMALGCSLMGIFMLYDLYLMARGVTRENRYPAEE